jgi:hypothetical protein
MTDPLNCPKELIAPGMGKTLAQANPIQKIAHGVWGSPMGDGRALIEIRGKDFYVFKNYQQAMNACIAAAASDGRVFQFW